ncbi:MAG TPA: LPS assembly protein LptD [Alphaproteobacteria bacterium]|nr:LPS assembly protein LptD [Alphaproteobacteria bacterium]
MARHLSILSLTVAACCAVLPARAQLNDEQTDEPAVLNADTVTFDETLNIVIASGDVEIWQGVRILRADRVTYNQRTEVVTATGNVILVEPTGEVVFADYAELEDGLASGFVENVSLLMTDDSRLIANSGVRREGAMEVERAVYSPCDLCEEDPRRAPIWQIRAVRVIHDEENKNVIYRDAFFDLFGLPILYTPYFSHPDPSVERRSGFLFPSFGTDSNIGLFLNNSYYLDIAPEQDATFDLTITRDAGFVLGGEYRRRFENGQVIVRGSVNRSDRIDDTRRGEQLVEDDWRGHFFGDARFDLSEHWRVGADINRTSDDTYLSVFNISEEDVLESRAYAEGFYGLSYASVEGYDFQDLRANSIEQATILPWINYNYVGEPGAVAGGQVFANTSVLTLIRDDEVEGTPRFPTEGVDTRRFSLETGWERTFYADSGLVTNLFGAVRGDLYWSDDFRSSDDPTVTEDNVVASRIYPRATVTARYPMVRQTGTLQQLIEPVAALTLAPDLDDPDDIPNNDSIDLEFDEINLFSANRYPGLDRIEDGTRATYGLRAGLFGANGGYATAFLGQSYRITGDEEFPPKSGLESDWSDYVGRITIAPSPLLNLDYRFRIDNDEFEARRQELTFSGGVPVLRGALTYTFLDDIGASGTETRREEVRASVSSRISQFWTARATARYDIAEDEARDFGIGLTYQDECLTFGATFRRKFTEDRDDEAGDSFLFVLALRNLGELPLNLENTSFFN